MPLKSAYDINMLQRLVRVTTKVSSRQGHSRSSECCPVKVSCSMQTHLALSSNISTIRMCRKLVSSTLCLKRRCAVNHLLSHSGN